MSTPEELEVMRKKRFQGISRAELIGRIYELESRNLYLERGVNEIEELEDKIRITVYLEKTQPYDAEKLTELINYFEGLVWGLYWRD